MLHNEIENILKVKYSNINFDLFSFINLIMEIFIFKMFEPFTTAFTSKDLFLLLYLCLFF